MFAIFAYGQSFAGKTCTMMGSIYEDAFRWNGIFAPMCGDMFKCMSQAPCSGDKRTTYAVKVAMLEVYLNDLHDLLKVRSANLKIRRDPDGSERSGSEGKGCHLGPGNGASAADRVHGSSCESHRLLIFLPCP